ncbi:MAG TPA: hypothetical protein PKM55_11470 [Acidobacteriota bacterium]|nr:hypothetical protein [Acidobacteriota bacterium]
MRSMLVTTMLLVGCLAGSGIGRAEGRPFLPVGVFIAPIEEGARIFTPVRLLPFDHPEAAGHEFPNALQLHGTEFDALVLLGRHAGLGLAATLQRYPRQPDAAWPYPGFDQPPLEALRNAAVVRRPMAEAPLPGLRAAGFCGRQLVGFIVDTRGLSLSARGMERPTAMGLDLDRAAFLEAVRRAADAAPAAAAASIVVYEPR